MLTNTTAVRYKIRIEPSVEPVDVKPYRLPETQKHEIRRQVEELTWGGIITESNFTWNSLLLIVPRKADAAGEKNWKLVIDYRKVNEKTVGDAYPLPDITEILDQLGQSKYFSCIDLVMGYHQIELSELDPAVLAFSIKKGIGNTSLFPLVKDGPSYLPAHDEHSAEWVNKVAVFYVS